MGGNALAKFGAERVDRETFHLYEEELFIILKELFPQHTFKTIPFYRGKETFGDMDILMYPEFPEGGKKLLAERVGSAGEYDNKDVFSFMYKNLQVDMIYTHDTVSAMRYYSYNDLGNLMGRIFRRLGLRYGHTYRDWETSN